MNILWLQPQHNRCMAKRFMLFAILAFCVSLLSGCGLPQKSKYGDTIESGTPEEMQAALDAALAAGANINITNKQGITPLMGAAYKNPYPESIRKLLDAGAGLDTRGPQGRTPLIFAAWFNPNPDIVKTLLEAGASIEAEDTDGATPLMAAMSNPNIEVARLLVASGANTRHISARGFTPLMLACRYAKPEVVKLLLEAGSNVNAKTTTKGITALMFTAGESSYPEIIDMLVQAGANVAAVDSDGNTALAVARKANNPSMERALLRAGAH